MTPKWTQKRYKPIPQIQGAKFPDPQPETGIQGDQRILKDIYDVPLKRIKRPAYPSLGRDSDPDLS